MKKILINIFYILFVLFSILFGGLLIKYTCEGILNNISEKSFFKFIILNIYESQETTLFLGGVIGLLFVVLIRFLIKFLKNNKK